MARKTASDFFDKESEETVENSVEQIKTRTEKERNSSSLQSEEENEVKSEKSSDPRDLNSTEEPESTETHSKVTLNKSAGKEILSSADDNEKDQDQDLSATTLQPQQSQNSTLTPEQEAYYAQYAQYTRYMQQYQQYYSQYYPEQPAISNITTSDPVYDYYTGATSSSTTTPATSFDSTRANRQMTAYFDPTKFQAVLSPEMQATQRAQKEHQQAKLTAKDIEAFKKRKIEKKKGKNKWFYE